MRRDLMVLYLKKMMARRRREEDEQQQDELDDGIGSAMILKTLIFMIIRKKK